LVIKSLPLCQIRHAPSATARVAAGNALMSPLFRRCDPHLTRTRLPVPLLTMMKLCQPVVNNQRSTLPKPSPRPELHANYGQLAAMYPQLQPQPFSCAPKEICDECAYGQSDPRLIIG